MGAPIGNNNAAKGKLWSHALERAAEYYPEKPPIGKNDKMKGIYEAAHRFWNEMMTENKMYGSLPYFKELGDRLDGRPKQQMELSQDPANPVFKPIEATMEPVAATRVYQESLKTH